MRIVDKCNGSEPATWVWVSDVLMDSGNEATVLDCCIMPKYQMDAAPSLRISAAAIEQSASLGFSDVTPVKENHKKCAWKRS